MKASHQPTRKKEEIMKKSFKIILIFAALLAITAYAGVSTFSNAVATVAAQETPGNTLHIDATFNPDTKAYSLGGFSQAQLAQMGLGELPPEVWGLLGSFQQLSLKISGETVELFADDAKLASVNWDKDSRKWLYSLIDGVSQAAPLDQQRAELWLEKADIQVTFRKSAEISQPLVLDFATLVNVDIDKAGVVSVEGFPTGQALPAEAAQLFESANIDNVTVCWSKGELNNTVNGAEIPKITLFEEGLSVVDKAFGLNLGDLGQLFQSQLGANIAYGGSMHPEGSCGQ